MPLAIGTCLGPYEIRAPLGTGGMGEVYSAYDTRLKRNVAIKVSKTGFDERFKREALAVAALNHPNICQIYDVGPKYLVMELVDGVPLRGPVPEDRALAYAGQILDALDAAHRKGIIHRDLKPANVLVTRQGVKLLDFGVAKQTPELKQPDDTLTETLTTTGEVLGTPHYIAPERLQGKPSDTRGDLFSFGCVLYELLTGRKAFDGPTAASVLAAVLEHDPPPLAVNPALQQVVRRCLAKDPDERFQTARDLKYSLALAMDRTTSGLGPAATAQAAPQMTMRRKRWWAAVAGLAVVSVGFGVWMLIKSWRTPATVPLPVPLTSYSGWAGSPSFSPDGERIAFQWGEAGQGRTHIYVKQIGEEQHVRLTGESTNDCCPAWSPDGRWIAFLRESPNGTLTVFLIPAIGGVEHRLTEVPANVHQGVTWHPGGRWIVAADRGSAQEPLSLYLISTESGEKRRVTFPPEHALGDFQPAFSPDGRSIVFSRGADTLSAELYLLNVSEDLRPVGEPNQLTSLQGFSSEVAWWADGRWILFASGRSLFNRTLWRMAPRVGGQRAGAPERVAFGAEGFNFAPTISRPGRIVYAQNSPLKAHILRLELAGSHEEFDMPMNSTRLDLVPQYSPDGKRIAFVSNRSGSIEIWVCEADGSKLMKLTSFGGPFVANPAWSPDGRRIAFSTRSSGASDVYVISAEGGKPEILAGGRSVNGFSSWSHDGKWIFLDSDRSGKSQVWRVPVYAGAATQVTRGGGVIAVESPDGRFVYFTRSWVDFGTTEIWRVPAEGGEETQIVKDVAAQFFSVTARGVYFFSGWSDPEIRRYNFASRKVETVGKVGGVAAYGLSLSPNDRWLLHSTYVSPESNLMMVEGYRP